jgi:hypothetical protein
MYDNASLKLASCLFIGKFVRQRPVALLQQMTGELGRHVSQIRRKLSRHQLDYFVQELSIAQSVRAIAATPPQLSWSGLGSRPLFPDALYYRAKNFAVCLFHVYIKLCHIKAQGPNIYCPSNCQLSGKNAPCAHRCSSIKIT